MALAGIFVLTGCGRKPNVTAQLTELEKAFPAAATSPAPAVPAETQPLAASPSAAAADPNTFVKAALWAVRSNDYGGSVIALEAVQRMPGVTPAQMMAAENAKQALTAELVARAANGDAQAKAQLAAIERTRSQ